MKGYTIGILILVVIATGLVIYGFSLPRSQDTAGAIVATNEMPALDSQGTEERSVEESVQESVEVPAEEPEAAETAPEMVQVKEFQISADEKRFDPATIQINEGDRVRLIFSFNDKDIYYGGLDIRSDYFNVQYRKNDLKKSRTIEFTAEETFTYTGYWPASNNRKASGQIVVN